MLNLTRKPGEKIVITDTRTGDEIVIEFSDYNTTQGARLRLKAPAVFHIDREERRQERQRRG